MDIKLPPQPWYRKYLMHIIAGCTIAAMLVYSAVLIVSPQRRSIKQEYLRIADVKEKAFMEFVEVEGIIHPIMTIQLNALESGFVERIVCDEGAMLKQGDTILILSNPDLMRTIDDERELWKKSERNLHEQEIQMEQRSIDLRLQTLDLQYQIGLLEKKLTQSREEFSMGIKSRAELDIVEGENDHLHRKLMLQMQSLRHDSSTTILRREMIIADRIAAQRKLFAAQQRTSGLVIRAPSDGQLGHLNLIIGQQVAAGSKIGEIRIMNQYKVNTQLSEYYVERIYAGLPAAIIEKEDTFRLRISRVVPEVKDRKFAVNLLFNDSTPENIRLGKSYRVKVELGQPEQAVVIPRGDFYQKSSGEWIYRIEKGSNIARRVPIEIGRQNPEQFEIIRGLELGDRVIVSGYERIGNADEVIIEE
ncbi:MAG: HlyD family efflux transporter periplasmic adaptor subunit [Bacteroidaceae bacterium]|nr:HlyD family efflux transporter periplasmic adaptor subunit [Bacteroidaceae bacterium]